MPNILRACRGAGLQDRDLTLAAAGLKAVGFGLGGLGKQTCKPMASFGYEMSQHSKAFAETRSSFARTPKWPIM